MDPAVLAALVTGVPLGGAGLIAYGKLSQQNKQLSKDLDTKAGADVVEVQYNMILNRLARIENKLDNQG